MKKNLFSIGLCFSTIFAGYSHQTDVKTRTAIQLEANKDVPTYFISTPNMDQIKAEDALSSRKGDRYRIGVGTYVNITAQNSGLWTTLPSGDKMWQLKIKNPGAVSLSFVFNTFKLANGSSFWVEDLKGEKVSKVLTKEDMLEDFQQNIAHCFSDEVILTLIDQQYATSSELRLDRVFYNYRFQRHFGNAKINESDASCEVNINCTEGANYQDEKRGVAMVDIFEGADEFVCTGSVVNNLAQDCKPLMLTALHCGVSTSASDMVLWKFYFNYEAPACTNPTSVGTLLSHYVNSCVRLSDAGDNGGDSGSDFLLLQMGTLANEAATITALKSASINAYWNGWDANNVASAAGVGIHHPAGDIKKISTYSSTLVSDTYGGQVQNTHWRITWVATANGHGVTEGGSSGSPLFTYNGGSSRIVGTLTGGSSYCTATSDPDLYGKVAYHWQSNGTTANRRLKNFLDPNNTGTLVLNGSANPCSLTGVNELTANSTDIKLYPNPITDKLSIDLTSLTDEVIITIYDISGKLISTSNYNAGSIVNLDLNGMTQGIYSIQIKSGDVNLVKRISKI